MGCYQVVPIGVFCCISARSGAGEAHGIHSAVSTQNCGHFVGIEVRLAH